jgi:DNA-binding response OmpR family regulator
MKSIIVVSPQVKKWGAFTTELGNQSQMEMMETRSGAQALAAAQDKKPVAVVIDQDLGDMTGIELVVQLLQVNAMINVALVSDQSENDFHESTEGLGILMKLPPIPDEPAAVDFLECLSGVI